jgi:hypothetical protein
MTGGKELTVVDWYIERELGQELIMRLKPTFNPRVRRDEFRRFCIQEFEQFAVFVDTLVYATASPT